MFRASATITHFLVLFCTVIFKDRTEAVLTTGACVRAGTYRSFFEDYVANLIDLDGKRYNLAVPAHVTEVINKINAYKGALASRIQEIRQARGISASLSATLSKFAETLDKLHSSLQQQITEIKELERKHIPFEELDESKLKAPEVPSININGANAKPLKDDDIRKHLNDLVQEVNVLDISPADDESLRSMIDSLTPLMEIHEVNERIKQMYLDALKRLEDREQIIQQKEKHLQQAQREITTLKSQAKTNATELQKKQKECDETKQELAALRQQLEQEKEKAASATQQLGQTKDELELAQEKNTEIDTICEGPIRALVVRMLKAKITRETPKEFFWATLELMHQVIKRGLKFMTKMPATFWTMGTNVVSTGFSPGNIGLGLAARTFQTQPVVLRKTNDKPAPGHPAGTDDGIDK